MAFLRRIWIFLERGGAKSAGSRGGQRRLASSGSASEQTLGIAGGTSVTVMDPGTVHKTDSLPSSPFLTTRLLLVTALTVVVSVLLALVVAAPLEEAANPEVTPNPAAGVCWRRSAASHLVNPAPLLLVSFVAIHFSARKLSSSTRTAAIATFAAFIVAFALLTWTGTALHGPNWDFFWPWQEWPTHPIAY